MKPYSLPDLDYDFAALEPHISGEIMELHHGKHHKAYVDDGQRDAREDRRGSGEERFLRHRRSRESARLQRVGPRAPLDLLEEPLAPRAGGRPEASSAAASRRTSAASTA